MTFKIALTFPIIGPNKLPRFKRWHQEHASEIDVSLPPEVSVRSAAMTVRLKSVDDRQILLSKLAAAQL
jgi:hypothetical protein